MFARRHQLSRIAVLLSVAAAPLLTAHVAQAQCAALPLAGCKQPTVPDKALLLLKDKGGPADKLTWKWIKGEETLLEDLGDPTATTGYTLCIYDASGGTPALELQAMVPPGGTCDGKDCWEAAGTGFKFKDPSATNAGISKMIIKSGDAGKAKIVIKGKGDFLDMADLPLDQDPQSIVQLSNSDGTCWEARFSPPAIKNEDELFKDKGDAPITGPTPTATNTGPPAATFTSTPTPTVTPMGSGNCGNNVLEPGETCMSCAADCVVQPCTAVGPTIPFTMTLVPPAGQSPSGATVLLGYNSAKLSIPGTGSASSVLARITAPAPAPNPFIRNDQNYALSVVLGRPTPIDVLFTVTFDRCQGAPAPTVADLGCSIVGCASGGPPIEGCGCSISQP
jgi:hypothetical protein